MSFDFVLNESKSSLLTNRAPKTNKKDADSFVHKIVLGHDDVYNDLLMQYFLHYMLENQSRYLSISKQRKTIDLRKLMSQLNDANAMIEVYSNQCQRSRMFIEIDVEPIECVVRVSWCDAEREELV